MNDDDDVDEGMDSLSVPTNQPLCVGPAHLAAAALKWDVTQLGWKARKDTLSFMLRKNASRVQRK